MVETVHDFCPEATDLALVVVDIQPKISAPMPELVLAKVVRNTNILLAAAEEFDLPVIVAEQYPAVLGHTRPEVNLTGSYTVVEKMAFSFFGEPGFVKALKDTGRRSVILCGMEAHICIYQIALDLLKDDCRVFVAADAVCSRSKLNWKLSLGSLRQAGAVVTPTESIVFQLLGRAGGERFKRLSNLVK